MEAKLFNKTDTGLLTVLSSVSVGSSFKQLKCLWNPVPMVAPPWPTQTPPIYSLNPSPLSQNMGRTQQVPSSPPLYAIWCSSARVVVDLICWIWSKRNVVLQSASKCLTDLYNKLLLSFPNLIQFLPRFCPPPPLLLSSCTALVLSDRRRHPIYDWSFLDWRLKEMISWSQVYVLYLLLSLSPARYGPETSSDIDSIKNISHKKWKIFEVLSERVLLQLQQCHRCNGWWIS